jgi:predicted outer membrane repeat protein
VYGGFADTGDPGWGERDPDTYVTILSGDIGQDDTNDDGNNIAETWSDIQGDNAYHVVVGAHNATLDGLTITAGEANGSYPNLYGGGLYNVGDALTLTSVTFSGNRATSGGGGMYNASSSDTTLEHVTFTGNSAGSGGGMFNENSSPTLTNVTFTGNSVGRGAGGGMSNDNSDPTLTNVIFSDNRARIVCEQPNAPQRHFCGQLRQEILARLQLWRWHE